jgi:uracil-DNA glycosylase family 4
MFCHLHVHNEFSQLDGMGKSSEFAEYSKRKGFTYLGLTNHGNIDGVIKFQKECNNHGIVPIIGCEAYIVGDIQKKKTETRHHICLFVKDNRGWRNLTAMMTEANLRGFYKRPCIDFELLLKKCSGLVVSAACVQTFLKHERGIEFFEALKQKIGDDLYLEVMPHDIKLQYPTNDLMIKLSKKYGNKIIATNDCHYIRRTDWEAQEVLLAIQRQAKWNDPKRWRFNFKGLHLRTEREMTSAFKKMGYRQKQIETWLENTCEVAEKCKTFSIKKRNVRLPKIVDGDDYSELEKITWYHFRDKIIHRQDIDVEEYKQRVWQELLMIESKNFSRYILIVWDLIKWCKANGIFVGPGRGSVGGSLIAYLIGITSVDPIKYGLLFERFITEDRIDFPDIDIDFEDRKRHLVRQYLENKYGEKNVASVSSFARMKPRSIIREVGKVFEVPYEKVDSFAKMIESDDTLEDAIERTEEGQLIKREYPDVVRLAKRLEGQIKNYGKHAAAIVISNRPISKGGRCNLHQRGEDILVNWEKEDTEFMGLMKLDVLGLKLLSVLSETLMLIKENHKKEIILEEISLEDEKVLKSISQGDNTGVFQLGTWATGSLIAELKEVKNFEEIAAIVALVRPGPMQSGMTKDYIERRESERWDKKNSIYEEITRETFGVLVYQEQVMAVISKVAGLPYSTADKIRKVIGKKRTKEEFAPYKKMFIEGCLEQKTFNKREAEEFWEGLLSWARYGFNKCLVGSTKIERANYNQYSPKYLTIEDLYIQWHKDSPTGSKYRDPKRGIKILQVDQDGRIRPGKVKGVYYNGKRLAYKITTKGGRQIEGTGNHRLLTKDGYKTIDDIRVNDWLAIKGNSKRKEYIEKAEPFDVNIERGKKGFQKRLNGPVRRLQRAKLEVFRRANGSCEECGKQSNQKLKKIEKHKFEFAHIKQLKDFNEDYTKYHHRNNIKFLCNSCHKKMDTEQRGWFKQGYGIAYDRIVKIETTGLQDVFDIEMEAPNHNFLANGIVSHNSHSVEYALLGYWCAWLKHYYPTEFISASLSYGAEAKKEELVDEAISLGLKVKLPKVGISHAQRWIAKDNCLYVPFQEVKNIGPQKALEACAFDNTCGLDRFFKKKTPTKHPGKLGKILDLIGAYDEVDPDITPEISALFDFQISGEPSKKYPKLWRIFTRAAREKGIPIIDKDRLLRDKDLQDVLSGDVEKLKTLSIVKKKSFRGHKDIRKCEGCGLREECTSPVPPSKGIYNIMIIGEAPGFEEDQKGEGFVGRSGDKLWKELLQYKLTRQMFHVTNIAKCYPKQSRKPSAAQIKKCSGQWLRREIRGTGAKLALAFGNTGLQCFAGRSTGIMGMSGKVQWNEDFGLWVFYCIHPASVLHNNDNLPTFKQSIKHFARLVKTML